MAAKSYGEEQAMEALSFIAKQSPNHAEWSELVHLLTEVERVIGIMRAHSASECLAEATRALSRSAAQLSATLPSLHPNAMNASGARQYVETMVPRVAEWLDDKRPDIANRIGQETWAYYLGITAPHKESVATVETAVARRLRSFGTKKSRAASEDKAKSLILAALKAIGWTKDPFGLERVKQHRTRAKLKRVTRRET